ncbi:MAG: hypothetical protein WBM44_16500, partial [Waterburya sp.]
AVLSGNTGEDFVNDTKAAQRLFRDSLDYQWDQYIGTTNSHPIWLISYRVGAFIAVAILMYFAVDIMKKLSQNNFLLSDLSILIKPIIVASLMANNGQGVGYLAKGMRYSGQVVNYWITDHYQVYLDNSQNFAKANAHLDNDEVRLAVNKAQIVCQDLFKDLETYNECMVADLKKQQEAGKEDLNFYNFLGNLIQGAANNIVDWSKYAVSSVALADERIKLFAYAISFNLTADITLFYTALYGPIAIATSMLPVAQNSLIVWLSAFYSIQFIQISYTIMISMLADILNNGRGMESFIYATLLGLILPTVAILFGAGAGMTLYSSLNGLGMGAAGQFSLSKTFSKIAPAVIKR